MPRRQGSSPQISPTHLPRERRMCLRSASIHLHLADIGRHPRMHRPHAVCPTSSKASHRHHRRHQRQRGYHPVFPDGTGGTSPSWVCAMPWESRRPAIWSQLPRRHEPLLTAENRSNTPPAKALSTMPGRACLPVRPTSTVMSWTLRITRSSLWTKPRHWRDGHTTHAGARPCAPRHRCASATPLPYACMACPRH